MEWVFGRLSGMGGRSFTKRVVFRVWNDKRVRFWKDSWCGEDSLKEAFPMVD